MHINEKECKHEVNILLRIYIYIYKYVSIYKTENKLEKAL